MPHALALSRLASQLLVIDVQTRLMAAMGQSDAVQAALLTLVTGAAKLQVPVVISEQYPKGLGPTVPALTAALAAEATPTVSLDKLSFSCWAAAPLRSAIEGHVRTGGRRQVVVAGVETHVCVLQTVLDLLAAGLVVHVAVDGVTSRHSQDHSVALERLAKAGAVLTTVETILFEWLARAGTPDFKAVSALVKSSRQPGASL